MDRRATDRGFMPQATQAFTAAGRTAFDWAEKRKIAAHVVFGVTMYLTVQITIWSMNLPYDMVSTKYTGVDVGAMQAAVLGPWGLAQGAMFKFYMELISKNGNGYEPAK